MTVYQTLAELLSKARQRSIAHILVRVFVLALAVSFACAAIILLAGTEVLNWIWCPVAFIVSLGIGLWRARREFPSSYVVAQRIDARLQLADSLSTATYFSDASATGDAAQLQAAQRRQAEKLVPSVDLKTALPLARPRAFYPAMALAAAVIGLFVLRYAVQGSFDPHASLVKNAIQSAVDNFFSGPKEQALAGKPGDGSEPGDKNQQKAEAKNADFAGDSQFDPTAPEPRPQPNEKDADKKDKSDDAKNADSKSAGKDAPDKSGDKGDKQNQDGNQNANQDAKNGQDPAKDPSMMDKLREAVNDLMNKMKAPSDSAKSQKGEPQSDAEKQPGQDGQTQDKNQGDSADSQKSSQQSADGESGKNASQKKSTEQQQGMGTQEGDKTAKEAEALKAMGKISELLGKRAENVKGSVTMEVGQTKQQLKTEVTERASSHNEAGGEIHRDAVPPAYEEFVQQYFEQVRKTSPPKSPSIITPFVGN